MRALDGGGRHRTLAFRSEELKDSLPKDFDWRTGMPDGSSALEPVMDQGPRGGTRT